MYGAVCVCVWGGRGGYGTPMSVLVQSGRQEVVAGSVVGEEKNRNKTTTTCLANPAVNESGSLQHFFYALLIPRGDKRSAEPAAPAAKHPANPPAAALQALQMTSSHIR